MDTIIRDLKQLFQHNGISVFGIAESGWLESEPEGYRPSDMLADASRILCFGIPVPRGLLQDRNRLNMKYWRLASIYYQKMDFISSQAAVTIESHGETASPVLS
jgi:hypothetical protein